MKLSVAAALAAAISLGSLAARSRALDPAPSPDAIERRALASIDEHLRARLPELAAR